ncbi:MAG: radical SAM protein [Magnetococcales bacterium]|nr:radical SAM protein [Magnetococcales bacterium]
MPSSPLRLFFADLTHTGALTAANVFPYGAARVAAQARAILGDGATVELFKYPADFAAALARGIPEIVCFSNYLWNIRLLSAFARRIKEVAPRTVILAGGPNYPVEPEGQAAFLAAHPEIDFYLPREGEPALAELLPRLLAVHLDATALKQGGRPIPGVHYRWEERAVRGEPLPRLVRLDDVPSPYLLGLLDKFFDDALIPVIETNRGCPFSCTFCVEGEEGVNPIHFASLERLAAELAYIAQRRRTPDLLISDSNFGMYKRDLEVCDLIARWQRELDWPKYVANSSGKNQKARLLEAARRLNGALILTNSVQSLDEKVLETVKRKNISLDQIMEVGRAVDALGGNNYCEIILGLPGDSREGHFRSVMGMIDAGIHTLMTYQMMLLPGTEAGSEASRRRHGLVGRFRALPRCFGIYECLGAVLRVAEIEEIAVASHTLAPEDYYLCRALSLSVELFHNGGLFRELIGLLGRFALPPSRLLSRLHETALAPDSPLRPLYDDYLEENRVKLWEDAGALEVFLQQPGIIERHISGELGSGELYKAKALAFFQQQEALHVLAFAAAAALLGEAGVLSPELEAYLRQLRGVSLARKENLLDDQREITLTVDFDFPALERGRFLEDPLAHRLDRPMTLRLAHSAVQRQLMASYVAQYGTTLNGLGRILLRSHVGKFYRTLTVPEEGESR